ncbi:MAG: gas vesicle protein GvpJ [Bacillota bacterium]
MNDVDLDKEMTLLDLLDRLLNKGIVLVGDLTISVANIDLLYVGVRLLISSVETLNRFREIDEHE